MAKEKIDWKFGQISGACFVGAIVGVALATIFFPKYTNQAFLSGYFGGLIVYEIIDAFIGSPSAELYKEFFGKMTSGAKSRKGRTMPQEFIRLGLTVKWILLAGHIGTLVYLISLVRKHETAWNIILEANVAFIALLLAVHFHCTEVMARVSVKREAGEELTASAFTGAASAATFGRLSHLFAATLMLLWMGDLMYTLISSHGIGHIIICGLLLGILPLWHFWTINKGYGALYLAEADYALGRKRFEETEPTLTSHISAQ